MHLMRTLSVNSTSSWWQYVFLNLGKTALLESSSWCLRGDLYHLVLSTHESEICRPGHQDLTLQVISIFFLIHVGLEGSARKTESLYWSLQLVCKLYSFLDIMFVVPLNFHKVSISISLSSIWNTESVPTKFLKKKYTGELMNSFSGPI